MFYMLYSIIWVFCKIKSHTAVRRYHVYKNDWVTKIGENLTVKKDTREEALH